MEEVIVVGVIIQVVLHHLLSSMNEIKLNRHKRYLTRLKDSLLRIADHLDHLSVAEVQQASKEALKLWLEQLENVAFEADVVLDELNKKQTENKQMREESKVIRSFLICSSNVFFVINMNQKIKNVNSKLELINKEFKVFGLDHMANPGEQILPAEQQIDSFLIEPNYEGREDEVSKIVEMLISAPSEETYPVFSIVGMPGLGKTTLARKIFQHESIGAHFAEKIWVNVSGNFSVITLLKMILETLTDDKDGEVIVTIEVALLKILRHLEGKRYLLVLDNVCNENSEEWDGFICLLSKVNSVKGNVILVTNGKEIVSSVTKPLPTHQLSSLSNDECWSIVKSKVLPKADVNFGRIGNCIAQRCGGSPAVAEVVGNLLRGKSIDEWLFILENQFSNFVSDNENYDRQMLKLIYDHIQSLRKKRFAYFSIFPQDIRIKRKHLIMLWMAEEYLQVGQEKYVGIVGNRFFNYLLQNLLQNVGSINLPHTIGKLSCFSSNDCGADIGATIHVVLQNLRSVSFEEIKVMFGFEKHLTKLEKLLIRIQGVISDPEVKQTNNRDIKCWLEQLEAVAFETDAILYELIYLHLRKKIKNQIRETKKVTSYLPSATTKLLFNREMTHKIKDVNEKLEMMSKHVDTLGLEMTVLKSIQPPFWGF